MSGKLSGKDFIVNAVKDSYCQFYLGDTIGAAYLLEEVGSPIGDARIQKCSTYS